MVVIVVGGLLWLVCSCRYLLHDVYSTTNHGNRNSISDHIHYVIIITAKVHLNYSTRVTINSQQLGGGREKEREREAGNIEVEKILPLIIIGRYNNYICNQRRLHDAVFPLIRLGLHRFLRRTDPTEEEFINVLN